VDGEPVFVRPGETFEIAAGVKRIDINAFVLTYQAGNPTVFYRLEGFDEGETVSRLSDLGDISYTNLNGGSYTFHYGVRDYETGEVLSEITLPIVKRYSWYQQPAVQTAMVALGLLVLAGLSALVMRIRYQRATRALQQEYEQKQRDHLQQIAYQDYLTGLYNRNYLAVWNERQASDPADPVTFVSIDLNDLKKVNDSHGHKYGDQLLCEMSGLLKRHFSGEKYAVMRIGGDEFLVLARGADSAEVGRAMEAMTAEAAGVRVSDIPVTFAYGMCTQRAEAFDFEAGLRESDLRLLENKDRFHGRTPAE